MIRQFELVEKVKSYDPSADEDSLNRAYVFATKAHGSQTRLSGDPYFSHPLEVAGILTEYKVDNATIITALLHDTIEDTETTLDEIKGHFGDEAARLVDGVTKLTRIEFQSDQAKQAENFRKFVLAMSEDIRVLLVKLADRLHNMRTLHYIRDAEKRRRIAMETMDIYAPLAERIGMQGMKTELEDLAFAELNPDARNSILKRLEFLRERGGDLISRIIAELTRLLADHGIEATITGREKTPYSIWNKMQHKEVAFEQLADIMAFRVVVDTVEDCYRAFGVAHGAYPMVPNRFKDYISTPSRTDTDRCTPASSARNASALSCRSAPRICTTWPSTVSPRTGTTSRTPARPTGRSIAGCASFWKSLSRRRDRRSSSNTPSSKCSRTKCSASRPVAT
jgi:GTP diphosphokinase / guanosine-3',5'-bis(diphosphate) 3'-diphosphatase